MKELDMKELEMVSGGGGHSDNVNLIQLIIDLFD